MKWNTYHQNLYPNEKSQSQNNIIHFLNANGIIHGVILKIEYMYIVTCHDHASDSYRERM